MSLNKRGKRVRAVAILIATVAVVMIIGNLWWVGIDSPKAEFIGWCWGSLDKCLVL
jgi:hypothetical protein